MKKKPLTKEQIQQATPEGHPIPVTRRQFLAQGLTDGLGFMVLPSMIDLFLRPSLVMGDECPKAGGAGNDNDYRLLVIDTAGGPIQNNFLPLSEGKALLGSYSSMGIPDGSLTVDNQFGIPLRIGSQLRTNLLANLTTPAALAATKAGVLAVQSSDDNSGNRQNPTAYAALASAAPNVAKAQYFQSGLTGLVLAGRSRGISRSVLATATPPLTVSSVNTVLTAVNPSFTGLNTAQRQKLISFAQRLTISDRDKLRAMTNGQQLATALGCSMEAAAANGGGAANIDARQDARVQAVFTGITATSDDQNTQHAQIVYSLLQGHALSATIEVGDCDNHGQGDQAMNDRHGEIGTLIGRALELAFRMQQNLCILVITDGAQSSNAGQTSGRSDAGDKALMTMIAMRGRPGPAIQLLNGGMAGHFTAAQSAATTTYIGANPTRAALAAFGTYLALQGRLSQFASLVPSGEFDPAMLSKFIVLS